MARAVRKGQITCFAWVCLVHGPLLLLVIFSCVDIVHPQGNKLVTIKAWSSARMKHKKNYS